MRRFIPVLFILICLSLAMSGPVLSEDATDQPLKECAGIDPVFRALAQSLVKDGFQASEVCAIFANPAVKFNPQVMPRKVVHREASLHYDIFLERQRIERAKRYLDSKKNLFASVEKEYGIPKEVKVAILLVETDLGRYLGSDLALNNLASMAVASDFNKVRAYLPDSYKKLSRRERKRIQRKLDAKSKWAYSELKSLIIYADLNGLDIHKIKGSIFGAIGLCQFMPSNALRFGVDFDKDGKVDLFDPADALASMANYLQFYGWKPNIHKKGKIRVIKHYNHSTPYARTVLKVAEKVRQI